MAEQEGKCVMNTRMMKVGPCSFCPQKRVVLAAEDQTGKMVFFCRACVVKCEVVGPNGIVRDASSWPDLIGTEAN